MNKRQFSLNLKSILIVLLLAVFFISSTDVLEAKKKRSKRHRYSRVRTKGNPAKAKAQALDALRTGSEELCNLAGVNRMDEDSIKIIHEKALAEESELLSTEGEYGEDLAELEAEDDVAVDLDNFKNLWLQSVGLEDNSTTDAGIRKQDLMDFIMDWIGTRYRFGGSSSAGIDCSAFTQKAYLTAGSLMLPRVAREQVNIGKKIKRDKLQFGDLIFFHTYSRKFASHAGIYLGDDLFAHAGSRYGVTVSSLNSTYYQKRFIGGRRLTAQDVANLSIDKGVKMNAGLPDKK